MRGKRVTLPAGRTYYLTVDRKTLNDNQAAFRANKSTAEDLPPIWVQIDDDKQNRINCWQVNINGGSAMVYGDPSVAGAMVYMRTTAELDIWV